MAGHLPQEIVTERIGALLRQDDLRSGDGPHMFRGLGQDAAISGVERAAAPEGGFHVPGFFCVRPVAQGLGR